MQLRRHRLAFALLLIGTLCCPAWALAGGLLQVIGIEGPIQTWSADQLKTAFASDIKPVEFTTRGQKHTGDAVPLLAVLGKVGVPNTIKMDPKADPRVKNFNLRLVVVVQATDGYTAAFSLAELLPGLGNRDVWLILNQDGMPLPDREGVAKLYVPQDVKNIRWVRDIGKISVVDPVESTTQPSTAPASSR